MEKPSPFNPNDADHIALRQHVYWLLGMTPDPAIPVAPVIDLTMVEDDEVSVTASPAAVA